MKIEYFVLAVLLAGPMAFSQTIPSALLSRDCGVAANQRSSFMAPVPQTMKLLVDNTFSKSQKKEIAAAAATWNKAGAKWGWKFYDISFVDLPTSLQSTKFDCSEHFGGRDFLYLIRVDSDARWRSLGLPGDGTANLYSPGDTQACYHPISFEFYQEAVLIDTNVTDSMQFQSIVLHELGHALGLKHSCDGVNPESKDPTFVGCSKIPFGDPYHEAVMYPSLRKRMDGSSIPEEKNDLRQNDLTRLECLYGPK